MQVNYFYVRQNVVNPQARKHNANGIKYCAWELFGFIQHVLLPF
jgi:hypothetical protein